MDDKEKNLEPRVALEISFPKSSEDHRLQLISINGAMFAIVHSPLESDGPIRLFCEEWSVIAVAPIKSKTNILISAINVMCFNDITSEEGMVNIHASNRLVKFTPSSPEKVCQMGERGETIFTNDPGALLYYNRLFDSIVNSIHNENPDSFAEAQQKFITGLCTLADKIEGKTKNLNLNQVLDIWGIPHFYPPS